MKIFISYSHDSKEHLARVLQLSNRLRHDGLDCWIDQYEQSPAEGWALWCDEQIEEARFVLVVCTDTYLRRFKKKEVPGKALGVTWEGNIITQELYNSQGRNDKFIPVIFSRADSQAIPLILQGPTLYSLEDLSGYEALYRRLTGQPEVLKPVVGAIKTLRPSQQETSKEQGLGLWNVPQVRNPFFTAREESLTRVAGSLRSGHAVALSGLAGVGKTQIASEYAYRHRHQYRAVFWVKAESRQTLVSDFASIAILLGLPEAAAKEEETAVAAAKRWLESNSRWLLILDNADEVSLLPEFLPTTPIGDVLLTTRARSTGPIAEPIIILPMEPEQGAQFLLRRGRLPLNDALLKDEQRNLALELSEELGNLPLALDQAGAFIEETPASISEYLELYREHQSKLLKLRGKLADGHPSVHVTFKLAFAKVKDANTTAGDLLRLSAFVAPEDILEEIFIQHFFSHENYQEGFDQLKFAEALREAGRFSLVRRDPLRRSIDIHRLVQAVLRDAMTKEEQEHWVLRSLSAVDGAFNHFKFAAQSDVNSPESGQSQVQAWSATERLLPHVQFCTQLAQPWTTKSGTIWRAVINLQDDAGRYLVERGRLIDAESLYQQSLALVERQDANRLELLSKLNALATVYFGRRNYPQAESLFRQALEIVKQYKDDPDIAVALNNLGLTLYKEERYAEAEPVLKRALQLRHGAYPDGHPNIAQSVHNLGAVYRALGKYDDAERLLRAGLEMRAAVIGPQSTSVASSLFALGQLYENLEKTLEAQQFFQRALAIQEKHLAPESPELIDTLCGLARTYYVQGEYTQSETLCRRAIQIGEKAFGEQNPELTKLAAKLSELRRPGTRAARSE